MGSDLLEQAKAEIKRRKREQFWDTVMWALIPVPVLLTVVVEIIRRFK